MNEERRKILDMVGSGQISPEQGASLLKLVSDAEPEETEQPEENEALPLPEAEVAADRDLARPFWMIPLGIGLILLVVGSTVARTAHQQQRVTAWTWLCGWIPLVVGLSVVTLAAWARTAHWIHLRVRDHGQNIALSLPLPLGLAAVVIRVARPFVPQLRDTAVDEAILALRDGLEGNEDITIAVQDDDEGESVQILFGGKR
jgi:hypothetical protein